MISAKIDAKTLEENYKKIAECYKEQYEDMVGTLESSGLM
jgi:hypothetical protein